MITLLAAAAANSLAAAVWQGILLAAIVALCLRLLPALSAAARSIIWTAAFTLAFLLHFAPHATIPGSEMPSVHVPPVWTLALCALWLLLSLARAIQLLVSAVGLRRLARNAAPVAVYSTPRTYILCTSPDVDRPSVIGFFRPRILLPPSLYAALTAADLRQIVLHETEHLRRCDDWTNLLQKLALVLFPLNPALLWMERRLCLERELACDDAVLLSTGAPKAYATCLTSLAEHTLLRRGVFLALGILGVTRPSSQSELSRRVHRILRAPQRTLSGGSTALLTASLLFILTVGALKLTRTPQLISFVAAQGASATQVANAFPTSIPARADIPQATFVNAATHVTPDRASSRVRTRKQRPPLSIRKALTVPTFRTAELVSDDVAPSTPRHVVTQTSAAQVSLTYISTVAIATPDGWLIIQL